MLHNLTMEVHRKFFFLFCFVLCFFQGFQKKRKGIVDHFY